MHTKSLLLERHPLTLFSLESFTLLTGNSLTLRDSILDLPLLEVVPFLDTHLLHLQVLDPVLQLHKFLLGLATQLLLLVHFNAGWIEKHTVVHALG